MKRRPLVDLLKDRGIRFIDLATGLGVDKATVTRWGQGEIPVERVRQVSDFTGIPAQVLRPDLASIFQKRGAS